MTLRVTQLEFESVILVHFTTVSLSVPGCALIVGSVPVQLHKSSLIAQGGGKCCIPGNIQGQVGQASEQPNLVEGAPAHCRGIGLDDL